MARHFTGTPLDRASAGHPPAAPVRIVHLGLGNFFRAHQAWYTAHAPDAAAWGIAAFTGRSATLATALTEQEGLFTLLNRASAGDDVEVVNSVSRAHPGSETPLLLGYLADPAVTVVTLTVTEAGYLRGPDGGLDLAHPDVLADLDLIRELVQAGGFDPPALRSAPALQTVPGRLTAGLLARRAAGAGPLSVVPCDNLPDNGRITERVVTDFAGQVDPFLESWMSSNVGFITTMVDRITPHTAPADIEVVATITGFDDRVAVVTEPFSEWALCGTFTAPRPNREAAGASVVADIAPFEQRKLWILNGGHSLLAYLGSARGHTTIAEAMDDDWCRAWLTAWWDEATAYLTLPPADLLAYREAVRVRFTNPAIRHLLRQIATDGSQKLPIRVLPVLRRTRADGHLPAAAVMALAGWVRYLRNADGPVPDSAADRLAELSSGPVDAAVAALIGYLDDDLGHDAEVVAAVVRAVGELR